MTWNILGWDDEPQTYLNSLKKQLEATGGFKLEIYQDIVRCAERFSQDPAHWDCAILDVLDNSDPENQVPNAGTELAMNLRARRPGLPVIFLTDDLNKLYIQSPKFAQPMMVRSKSHPNTLFRLELTSFLESCPHYNKVFLIYGRNKYSDNIKEEVKTAIELGRGIISSGVECVTIDPDSTMNSITESLQRTLTQCGVIVAICTPDDAVDGTWFQPRQNVLLEIGMALGISDGFERLIILQRWGIEQKFQARLPTDLGGALTIRFYDQHDDAIDAMLRALRERGVAGRSNS